MVASKRQRKREEKAAEKERDIVEECEQLQEPESPREEASPPGLNVIDLNPMVQMIRQEVAREVAKIDQKIDKMISKMRKYLGHKRKEAHEELPLVKEEPI